MSHFIRLLSLVTLVGLLVGCSQQPRVSATLWNDESDRIDTYHQRWLGTPYSLGGRSEKGIDCSAFVQNLYQEIYGLRLPRTTEGQAEVGYSVVPSELEPGDLIFFKTGWRLRHVGVYIGRGQFVHASTSVGVTRSSLNNPYWLDVYWKSKRVL